MCSLNGTYAFEPTEFIKRGHTLLLINKHNFIFYHKRQEKIGGLSTQKQDRIHIHKNRPSYLMC
jgi:hypothetical protein